MTTVASALVTLSASCISTAPETVDSSALCLEALPSGSSSRALSESVVIVDTDLAAAGYIECSGVALAPTLVVTDSLCVLLPIELEPRSLADDAARPSYAGRRLHRASVDYTECAQGGTWQPGEDGDFSSHLGEFLGTAGITVSVLQNDERIATVGVRGVRLAPSPYRCWDDLALLVLEQPLTAPPVVLDLSGTERVGDEVVLSGSGRGMVQPYEVSARIEAVTSEAAEPAAPPRSLLIDEQVCDFESGGAVTAAATGALIGVIGDGTGEFCGDPSGGTLATRIAPFRRMLIQAVTDEGTVLRVSSQIGSTPLIRPCDAY